MFFDVFKLIQFDVLVYILGIKYVVFVLRSLIAALHYCKNNKKNLSTHYSIRYALLNRHSLYGECIFVSVECDTCVAYSMYHSDAGQA